MRLRNPQDMGHLLKARRRALGLSQAQLAERVGISRQWVVALEKGNPGISIGTVFNSMNTLGLIMTVHSPDKIGSGRPVSDIHYWEGRPGNATSEIDEVIENARAGTRQGIVIKRKPLPLSRRRKRPGGGS